MLRKNIVTIVTPPSLQAGIRDASRSGWAVLRRVDALESGAGVLAAELVGAGAAAGCLAPKPGADDSRYNVAPTRAEYVSAEAG